MLIHSLYFIRSGSRIHSLLLYSPSFKYNSTIYSISKQFQLQSIQKPYSTTATLYKFIADKSRVPKLNEDDIEEQFIIGSGPGGQNVNRLQNCVLLKHLPTGIVVKCHHFRLQHQNRKLAREKLIEALDLYYNKSNAVAEQKKRYNLEKESQIKKQRANLRELTKKYKESLKKRDSSKSLEEIENCDQTKQ